jgi:hypothetical protein
MADNQMANNSDTQVPEPSVTNNVEPTVQYDLKNNVPLPTKEVDDTPVEGQGETSENSTDSDSKWETDENPYKKRYLASTDEALKMKTWIDANKEKVIITDNLIQRMQSDEEFAKEFKALTSKEQKQVAQAMADQEQAGKSGQALDLSTLPPEIKEIVEERTQQKQETAKQQQEKYLKEQTYFESLEGENKDLLAKYDTKDAQGRPFNKVKSKIYDDTLLYMETLNLSFEDAGIKAMNDTMTVLNGKVIDPEKARAEGLVAGLETNTITNFGGSRTSTGKPDDSIEVDDYAKSIAKGMGVDVNSPAYKKIWQQMNPTKS